MISEQYKKALQEHHKLHPHWGTGRFTSRTWWDELSAFASKYFLGDVSCLDYGCGKGNHPWGDKYDPGNPKYATMPSKQYDLIFSLDVLEHVEPQFIDETLEWIANHCEYFFASISCAKAIHVLPNGWNAHLIIEPKEWWLDKLNNYFEVLEVHDGKGKFFAAGMASRINKKESGSSSST